MTDEDILKDAETTHQIVTNGLGTKGQRYSPLAKVNVDTVKDLGPGVGVPPSAARSSAVSSRSR